MSQADESQRQASRTLLSAIRRVRASEQLDKVLTELLAFIACQRTRIEEYYQRQKREASATSILAKPSASSLSPPHTRGMHQPLLEADARSGGANAAASPLAAHPPFVQDTLLLCSVAAGAFGRRADSLITARMPASSAKALSEFDFAFDTDGRASGGTAVGAAVPGGDRAARVQQRRATLSHFRSCMAKLVSALQELQAAVASSAEGTGASSPSRPVLSGNAGSRQRPNALYGLHFHRPPEPFDGGAPAMALTYGVGEVRDFAVHQRARAIDRLRVLVNTASPSRWGVESIVEAAWEISIFSPEAGSSRKSAKQGQAAAVEATRVVTPLRDPLSRSLIRTPCRGERCVHLGVFDAASFVRAAQRRAMTHPASTNEAGAACPLCRLFIQLHALRVDMKAVRAMEAYKEEGPHAKPLCADHCLEWNVEEGTCRVVEGSQSAAHSVQGQVEAEEEEGRGGCQGREAREGRRGVPPPKGGGGEGAAAIRKRRRVEIGGHVLFVDE